MSTQQFETIGKYVLLEKLAMGGMAEVFLSRTLGAGGISKFFAIKRILPQYADSPEFIEMFREEAKIAINLKHSNIVSIHEFGIQDHQFFLVMDYVEGRNLRQILNKMKKAKIQFSTEHIIYLIREIAAGLDHAHRCIDATTGKPLHITHRDMSPQNIMISFDGEVKIVDFGIAKAESQVETTRAGTLKGKFGYMSPEQAEGLSVDMRTDIFSLGIVMWEALANDRLFAANNEINTLRKIRDCHIPSLRKINPNIHSDLEKIVQKALARDKNLRYQTAAALHKDLNRFLNRQYPDFSSHDFAAYIKSIFADEILQSRKKLVTYAKTASTDVAFQEPKVSTPHSFDDKTLVTQPSLPEEEEEVTSSYVATETDVAKTNATETEIEENEPSYHVEETPVDRSGVDLRPVTHGGPLPSQAEGISWSQPEGLVDPEVTQSASTTVLDEEAFGSTKPGIPKEKEEDKPAVPYREIEFKDSPALKTEAPPPSRNRARSSTLTNIPVRHKRGSSSLLRGMVALCLGFVAFLGLAKYFPSEMKGAITSTSGVLGPVYTELGITGTTEVSSQLPPTLQEAPPPLELRPTPEEPSALPTIMEPAALNKVVGVTSEPSGAEIYLNGKKTGQITPTQMTLRGQTVTLLLKRKGYGTVSKTFPLADVDNILSFKLIKARLGYIDVDIKPLQEATVFIDDLKIEGDSIPLREYPIPADQSVTVKVLANNGKTYEQKVKLRENEKKLLTFSLGRPLRHPSSD